MATTYLIGLIATIIAVLIIGYLMPKKALFAPSAGKHLTGTKKSTTLAKLQSLADSLLTDTAYSTHLSDNYITITRQGKKHALLTLDPKLATHTRTLGDVPIINFRSLPTRSKLMTAFKDAGVITLC